MHLSYIIPVAQYNVKTCLLNVYYYLGFVRHYCMCKGRREQNGESQERLLSADSSKGKHESYFSCGLQGIITHKSQCIPTPKDKNNVNNINNNILQTNRCFHISWIRRKDIKWVRILWSVYIFYDIKKNILHWVDIYKRKYASQWIYCYHEMNILSTSVVVKTLSW